MARSLVGMDQFFSNSRVDAGLGQLECRFSGCLISGVNRFDHGLDSGAQFCALTNIVLAVLDRLAHALSC